ncbi:DUF453-domain-containing protein [Fomitiporia mediterranea MF3/22]|uniref:DUF453-domain-containing protein n=1 Tax=Fomitiporia mediterranea (strain MF3/22) TaxID=694068 RepID=UPI00044084E9|nr:DUF453-domain-containing protein [Fomitiporia mediterranea MF3/22]EJD07016.1 DUF453-domain-containing protein [Fomitiporia mediterranea MF3/22]
MASEEDRGKKQHRARVRTGDWGRHQVGQDGSGASPNGKRAQTSASNSPTSRHVVRKRKSRDRLRPDEKNPAAQDAADESSAQSSADTGLYLYAGGRERPGNGKYMSNNCGGSGSDVDNSGYQQEEGSSSPDTTIHPRSKRHDVTYHRRHLRSTSKATPPSPEHLPSSIQNTPKPTPRSTLEPENQPRQPMKTHRKHRTTHTHTHSASTSSSLSSSANPKPSMQQEHTRPFSQVAGGMMLQSDASDEGSDKEPGGVPVTLTLVENTKPHSESRPPKRTPSQRSDIVRHATDVADELDEEESSDSLGDMEIDSAISSVGSISEHDSGDSAEAIVHGAANAHKLAKRKRNAKHERRNQKIKERLVQIRQILQPVLEDTLQFGGQVGRIFQGPLAALAPGSLMLYYISDALTYVRLNRARVMDLYEGAANQHRRIYDTFKAIRNDQQLTDDQCQAVLQAVTAHAETCYEVYQTAAHHKGVNWITQFIKRKQILEEEIKPNETKLAASLSTFNAILTLNISMDTVVLRQVVKSLKDDMQQVLERIADLDQRRRPQELPAYTVDVESNLKSYALELRRSFETRLEELARETAERDRDAVARQKNQLQYLQRIESKVDHMNAGVEMLVYENGVQGARQQIEEEIRKAEEDRKKLKEKRRNNRRHRLDEVEEFELVEGIPGRIDFCKRVLYTLDQRGSGQLGTVESSSTPKPKERQKLHKKDTRVKQMSTIDSDIDDTNVDSVKRHADVYKNQLFHFFSNEMRLPLWTPSSADIGDVGFVTDHGEFKKLFNSYDPTSIDGLRSVIPLRATQLDDSRQLRMRLRSDSKHSLATTKTSHLCRFVDKGLDNWATPSWIKFPCDCDFRMNTYFHKSILRLLRAHQGAIANSRFMSTNGRISNPLPATFLRGGTSKGIYLRRDHLPSHQADWTPIFLGIMGSPDPDHGRQLNGMGGGVSSLSKICVVGPPSDELRSQDIDVEYTFCQVGIRDDTLDYSGNCGNLSSMIGVFAVDEGLCVPRVATETPNIGVVHAYNTNTRKQVDTSFPISSSTMDGRTPVLDLPQVTMAGVPGMASRIDLHFVSPAGARTGKLLPSGNPVDTLTFSQSGNNYSIQASLVDATNPSVFIKSEDLMRILRPNGKGLNYTDSLVEGFVEAIRQSGAQAMGLDAAAKAQPKIAVVDSTSSQAGYPCIMAHAYSMGVLHKAIPMTVGLCLGVTARIEGSLPWQLLANADRGTIGQKARRGDETDTTDLVRIRHPSGEVDVGADFGHDGSVMSAKVIRTGRRLMKGVVWW